MTSDAVYRAHRAADRLLQRHASVFGTDLGIYAGHVHRVIGLVGLQVEVRGEAAEPLGLAAFFHDSGIWFDGTWDYLPPSTQRALAELGEGSEHADLVAALITEHHRIRPARHPDPLVEAFRRADLTDVTAGLVPSKGVPRSGYRELAEEHPPRGFRPVLLRAAARGIRESPLRPMPMLKL